MKRQMLITMWARSELHSLIATLDSTGGIVPAADALCSCSAFLKITGFALTEVNQSSGSVLGSGKKGEQG